MQSTQKRKRSVGDQIARGLSFSVVVIICTAILWFATPFSPPIYVTNNYTANGMTIDPLWLKAAAATIFLAGVLCFSFRRRVQPSWIWRIAISVVLAAGTAPEIFPDRAWGFAHPHVFALFRWFPISLFEATFYSDPSLYSVRGVAAIFLLFILPFVLTLGFWLFIAVVLFKPVDKQI